MRFVTILIRNLKLRPLRMLITIMGVAAAVGGFSILTGLGRGLEEAWNSGLVKQGTHLLVYQKGLMNHMTGTINEHIAADIGKVAGVESVAAELFDLITLESGVSILTRGWSADSPLWQYASLIAGRRPAGGAPYEVVLGEGLAQSLDLKPGGTIMPFGSTLKVVGVARMDSVLSNNSMIMSLEGLQKLLDREGKITVLHIRVDRGQDANELEQVRDRLATLFPRFQFVAAQAAVQESDLYRFWRGMAWAASLVGLIMGLLIVFNTMLVAVLEKTREIGVLAAVGWSRRRILALILSESLLISALGGLTGIAIGYLGLQLLVMHPKLQGFVVVAPSLTVLLQQFIIILLIGIGGGFLPAWRALHLNLIDALKER